MTNAIVAQTFSRDQVELIKRTIAKGATDDELKLFIQQAERTGLDPFSRQVYAVKRWDSKERREVMAIQVSIDGFRLIAERTQKYAGQLGPYWCGKDVEWKEVWFDDNPPAAAKVAVLHKDFKEPLWAVARYDAYMQTLKDKITPNTIWKKMPDVMLAKCAESLALRKAFPQELGGLYTTEEMGQAENDQTVIDAEPVVEPEPEQPPYGRPSAPEVTIEQLNEPEQPTNSKQRPYSAEYLRVRLGEIADTKKGQDCSDNLRKVVASHLTTTFNGDIDKRYAFCEWAVGVRSTKEMEPSVILALAHWMDVKSFEDGVNGHSRVEAKSALDAALVDAQAELPIV